MLLIWSTSIPAAVYADRKNLDVPGQKVARWPDNRGARTPQAPVIWRQIFCPRGRADIDNVLYRALRPLLSTVMTE